MGNKIRNTAIIICILLVISSILISCSNSNESTPGKTHWKFEITPDKPMPEFVCKANTDYKFKTSGAIQSIYINGIKHSGKNLRAWIGFVISFKKDTNIKIDFDLKGVFARSGIVEVTKGITPDDSPRFIPLSTYQYSDFSYSVKRGMDLDIKRHGELYYAGYFKNGTLLKNELVKRNTKKAFRFMYDYTIRFKSAEIPFILVIEKQPHIVKLHVHHKSAEGNKTTNLGNAYLLKPGETLETPFWADKGDIFYFNTKIMVATGNTWSKTATRSFTAKTDGPIKLKAIEDTAVDTIHIQRNTSWNLKLAHNESTFIVVNRGDYLISQSKSRYKVDGKIMDRDVINQHPIQKDTALEFKGSVDPRPIGVWVVQRRFY